MVISNESYIRLLINDFVPDKDLGEALDNTSITIIELQESGNFFVCIIAQSIYEGGDYFGSTTGIFNFRNGYFCMVRFEKIKTKTIYCEFQSFGNAFINRLENITNESS